jgi:V-type H+-transporting ATPase subunit E
MEGKNQIKQMVNFILQEAHEKANEIMVKTEHDFNLEKQTLIHTGKSKINDQMAQFERDYEVKQRIERSNAITASRTKRMEARDALLQVMLKEAYASVAKEATKPGYKALVTSLIVQGLLTLENETEVEVCCRNEDVKVVEGCLAAAAAEFKASKKIPGAVSVTLSKQRLPSEIVPSFPSGPGVVITARQGTIVCDNTLACRLDLVKYEKLPEIRSNLFPKA